MDEPLPNLDVNLRLQMRAEIARIIRGAEGDGDLRVAFGSQDIAIPASVPAFSR